MKIIDTIQEVADVHLMNGEVEKWAGPVVDGSEEALEVDSFLKSEHQVFTNAIDSASPPLVCDIIVCV